MFRDVTYSIDRVCPPSGISETPQNTNRLVASYRHTYQPTMSAILDNANNAITILPCFQPASSIFLKPPKEEILFLSASRSYRASQNSLSSLVISLIKPRRFMHGLFSHVALVQAWYSINRPWPYSRLWKFRNPTPLRLLIRTPLVYRNMSIVRRIVLRVGGQKAHLLSRGSQCLIPCPLRLRFHIQRCGMRRT